MSLLKKLQTKTIVLSTLFVLVAAPSFAQGSGTFGTNSLVLLLFFAVMILGVLMAAVLGDRIIKLSAERNLDKDAAKKIGVIPSRSEIFPDEDHKVAGKQSKVIKLKKGFDIKLDGKAKKAIKEVHTTTYALKPTDHKGLQPIPKMQVKVGANVQAGDKIFFDKGFEKVFFTAPVSGEVAEIRRGPKRRLEEIVILADKETKFKAFKKADVNTLSKEDILAQLLESGAFASFVERPYGVIANPDITPKAIHISTFDSGPLGVDYNFIFNQMSVADFQAGIDALNKLTKTVHLNLSAKKAPNAHIMNTTGVQMNWFEGAHPAGLTGIQIHHVDAVNKGETVWTIKPEDVATIGRLFNEGKYDPIKYVAVAGTPVKNPSYVKTRLGASIENLLDGNVEGDNLRIISGNALTGTKVESNGYVGAKDNLLSVIKEGNFHEMFGWILPQYARPSISPTIPWSMTPSVKFDANTNTHGEHRAFVVTGQYEKVLPMDMYPQQLIKSIMYQDFDQMEGLGIYEVIEEDIALCEFVCTSKQELQSILREGLDYVRSQS
ncbi:MAG: Na(+)-translocating NADH-quinone reductase subunit A [Chitinophagales bacterium]